jgi:hypothetical protein
MSEGEPVSLSVDNILQSNTGSFSGATGNATLPTPTTAGSMVVLCATILGADGVFAWDLDVPTGFYQASGGDPAGATANKPYIFVKRNTSGEDTWTLTTRKDEASGNARDVVWAVFEVTGTGLDRYGADLLGSGFPINPGLYTAQYGLVNTGNLVSGTESAVASRTTGPTDPTPCFDNLAFAVWAATSADTTIPVLSGYTNGFAEVAQVSRVGSTRAFTMAVAVAPSLLVGSLESTASISPSSAAYAGMVVLFADGARSAPDIAAMTGFEFGTATGITAGSTTYLGTAPFDTVVGSPAVVTTNPRSGAYCAELSSVAAAEYLTWGCVGPDVMGTIQPTQFFPLVGYLNVYLPTPLPGADVELASCEAGSLANGMTVWYRSASQKIGVKVGTGTEVLSDATVAADTWISIDFRWDPRFTNHLVDWRIDYNSSTSDATPPVPQTQAVGAGTSLADPTLFRLGWSTAKTATVRIDDPVVSKLWGSYPIGDTRIVAVGPDQADTPTIVGTSTNFKTFTGGPAGTLSTWSAATTRSALNEIPPSVGSGVGTGLLQVTAAAGDYCEIPMATFTAAPNNVLRAVRWYAAACAASTAVATLSVKSVDSGGTMVSEVGQFAAAHGLDATTLRWLSRMHRGTDSFYQITQARMDGLKLRVGYSGDATPDIGVHAVLAEVAYSPADVIGVLEAEDGAFKVYARQDPNSGAIASYLVTTPAGTRGATANWTIGGSTTSQYVGPNTTYEKVIGSDDIANVTGVGLSPDPQPEV